jgi:rhamnose transport system permease protein
MAGKSGREIIAENPFSWKSFFLKWEWFLVLIFIIINIMNANLSPYYASVSGLFTATCSFLEKSFIALPMAYILILGDIDISVGSIACISAVSLALAYNAGVPMGMAIVVCLLVGTLCGLINGFILTRFTELAPMIVTLGTQILFRGIAEGILGDTSAGGLTTVKWFSDLYWGKVGVVPIMFIFFVVFAVIFGFVLHKTVFGRWLYAIGSNKTAAEYAGIEVQKIRLIVFVLTGLFSAVTGVFLASRMGSTKSDIATGYELEAISMAVLGGFSTDGGKGNFIGVILAIFIVGFLRYGLGLINVPAQAMLVIIGGLLIVTVMAPNLKGRFKYLKKAKK